PHRALRNPHALLRTAADQPPPQSAGGPRGGAGRSQAAAAPGRQVAPCPGRGGAGAARSVEGRCGRRHGAVPALPGGCRRGRGGDARPEATVHISCKVTLPHMQEIKRRQLAEAAEKRQMEASSRGVKNPFSVEQKKKKQEEMEKRLASSGSVGEGGGLRWQLG
uniref:Small VCP interacting protein n=1 Tax=Crocodylus porosus TaxID=8502 RepID=A0A7M4EK56_CROPO